MCVWFSPQEIIKCQGLDPLAFDFIVLKSAVHYRGDFTELSSHIVEVTGPGIHSSRLSDFAYEHITTKVGLVGNGTVPETCIGYGGLALGKPPRPQPELKYLQPQPRLQM